MTRQERIEGKLREALSPEVLTVDNESHTHSVPTGSETHFKVVVVSHKFEGASRVERHRMVNAALADELAGGLHALTMTVKTPEEWAASSAVAESPPCLGGSKAEKKA
jgi:BolA protein